MAKKVCTYDLSEPLDGVTTAKIDINAGDGNLTIDGLTAGEPVLASGALQYLENQGLPSHSMNLSNGQASYTLMASGKGQPWFHLPWAACNGATEWRIYLNPTVSADINAHTNGGNVKLNLAGMTLTGVRADTGGGNMEVTLPDILGGISVVAKTGAGNAVVSIPAGVAARIHATSGLGKVIVDSRFIKMDANTYQSPDYDRAADRAEITVSSGAGNVSVDVRVPLQAMAAVRS